MIWWLALLIGSIVGLINSIIWFGIISFFKKHKERRNIKKQLKNKNFLIPLDKRDYDWEKWKDLVDIDKQERDLQGLNERIFKKAIFEENTIPEENGHPK